MSTVAASKAIQLDWGDDDGVVTVTPRDQDRYVLTVRTLVERAQHGKAIETVISQLNLLQRELAVWLRKRQDVAQAYLTMRDGGFLFLVMTKQAGYSDSLEDALSDLDIQIANDDLINSLSVDVLAIPNSSEVAADTFIDSRFAIRFLEQQSERR